VRWVGGIGRGWEAGGEMAQTMYAHVNKCIKFFLKKQQSH
jgi:hypothetical protein